MENAAGNLKVFNWRKRRVSGTSFDHMNGANFTSLDSVKKTPIGRVKTTVEATHQDLANL